VSLKGLLQGSQPGEGEANTFGPISPGFYNYLAFGADSRTVYSCDGTSVVKAYALAGGAAPIKTYSADERFRFTRIELSPSGRWLFAGDTIKENAAFLVDLNNDSMQTLPCKFGKEATFSPDSRFLAMSSNDGPIQLWDLDTERIWSTFPNGGKRAVFFAFTPDSKILACVGGDLQLRFWSVELGEELLTLPIPSFPDFGIAFSDDGQTLITEDYSPGENGNDKKWKFGQFLSYSAADPN
jgi:WD40 repeat protein